MKIKYKCRRMSYDRDYLNWKIGDIVVVDEPHDVSDTYQLEKQKLFKGDECIIVDKTSELHIDIVSKSKTTITTIGRKGVLMRAESFKRINYEDKLESK